MANTKEYNDINTDIGSIEALTQYNWFYAKPYLDSFITGKSFVFMTRPELFLYPIKPLDSNDINKKLAYENMCNDPKFTQFLVQECHNKSDELNIKQLSYEYFSDIKSYFMPIITNQCKSAELNDISIDTSPMFNTRNGYNIILPTRSESSRSSSTFTLQLNETHNLDITKLFTLWVEYIANIKDGVFTANPSMIKNNILDYAVSIYVFILDNDGRTIKSYSRYTGCYPTNIPYSALGGAIGSNSEVELGIPMVYTHYETMNPRILEDFNRISLKSLGTDKNNNIGIDYIPISGSELLNKDKLFNGNNSELLNEPDRDPIIYYEKLNSRNSLYNDDGSARYVLSFGLDSMKNNRLKSLFDNANLTEDYDDEFNIYSD